MYVVYVDDNVDTEFRSPVAADLRVADLARRGIEASVHYDEGAC